MGWTMFFLFVALKVPLLALCWLVWWAIQQEPEERGAAGRGRRRQAAPASARAAPAPPRRGPHGDPAPLAAAARAHGDAHGRASCER